MAYLTDVFCTECQQTKQTIVGSNGPRYHSVCSECQTILDKQERDTHFTALDKLTLEERLRKIEEWTYDYKPTYVPEPRF